MSSGRHNTSCEGVVRLKSAAVWVTPLLVGGPFDSSCIFSAGDHDSWLGGGESEEVEPLVHKIDYYLDESDPDIVVLRRQDDGSFVAAFSAGGATTEGILEAAKEDYLRLMEANADLLGFRGDDDRKRSA